MTWSGVTIVENEAMKFHKYYVSPTKLLSLMEFVGTDHFMMASIFVGSILSSMLERHFG
jgi:hypothetical protein